MFQDFLQSLPSEITAYVVPSAYLLGGIVIGLIADKIILKYLKKLTGKTRWKGDEVIVDSLRGMPLIWFICAGVYYTALKLPLEAAIFSPLKQILTLIVIATATVVASKVTVGFVHLHAGKIRGIFASTSIFSNIAKGVVLIIGMLIGLQSIGITITPILTALGVGGLAVALALQDSLSNLFSGLHIIASRQVKPGEFVKIESGEQGYIEDITWRNTSIKTLSGNRVIIPNHKMASSIVTNYSQPREELGVVVEVSVSYDNDLGTVEKVTREVAEEVMKETPGGVPEYKPFVRFHTFADSNIKLNVIMRGKEYVNQFLLRHEFLKKLHERYKIEGINITSPAKPVILARQQ